MKYKEIEMRFRVQKRRWSDIFFQYTFVISLVLAVATLVIYIPFYQNRHELLAMEYQNEILYQELTELRTTMEENTLSASDLRYQELAVFQDRLKDQEDLIHLYYSQILTLLPDTASINSLQIDAVNNTVKFTITTNSERTINEYLVTLFETYGVKETESITNWILSMPEYNMLNDTQAQVVILYA